MSVCRARCSRRDFVGVAAGAFTAVALSGCASLALTRVPAPGGVIRLSLRQHPRLARPGGYLKLQPEAHPVPVYVLATEDGYAAVSPICTHLGCTVNIDGPLLVCPCHGSTYDRGGAVLRGPAERPLDAYSTTLDSEDELLIRLDAREG